MHFEVQCASKFRAFRSSVRFEVPCGNPNTALSIASKAAALVTWSGIRINSTTIGTIFPALFLQ